MTSLKEKTILALAALFNYGTEEEEKILFEGDSEYNHVVVTEKKGKRLLAFGHLAHEHETAYNPDNPDEPLFEYPGLMCPALALKPDSRDILLIGLGGAYLPGLFKRHRPDINLTAVEIDPLVARVARDYFDFIPEKSVNLVIAEGRGFLENNAAKYDQIWLDAYNGAYIPGPLMTIEFLELCRSRLKPAGVVVQNVHVSNPLYQPHINTLSAVFGHVYLALGKRGCNAALMAQEGVFEAPRPINQAFRKGLKLKGEKLGLINLNAEIKKMTLHSGPTGTVVLTDEAMSITNF